MSPSLIRSTVRGALVGFALFVAVALVQVLRSSAPLIAALQPVLALGVIGGVVGALAGPLVAAARRRGREE